MRVLPRIFYVLSKGLTSGWLPLSAVLTREDIYQIFYDDYDKNKTFLHSHTYSGNVLAASVALEVLTIFEESDLHTYTQNLGNIMRQYMQEIGDYTHKLENIRGIGGIVAADLICKDPRRRAGFEVYQKAVKYGALLRPLGNTLYWLPPLNTSIETLTDLKIMTQKAILAVDF
jgi:adenosylmethionine-8-amino-7-oxononanoate aminotransferase